MKRRHSGALVRRFGSRLVILAREKQAGQGRREQGDSVGARLRGGTGPAPTGVSGRTSGNATRGAPAVPTYGYPATRPVSRRSWTTERCSRTRRCAKRRISASGPLLRVAVVESVVVVERSARNAPHRGTKRSHIHRYPDLRGARVPPWGRLEGRVMGRGVERVRGPAGEGVALARERECLAQEGR